MERCERWNIEMNRDKFQAIYFSRVNGQAVSYTRNYIEKSEDSPFKEVKYACVMCGENDT